MCSSCSPRPRRRQEILRRARRRFRLNDYWRDVHARPSARQVLRGLENTDYLQAIALLATYSRGLAHTGDSSILGQEHIFNARDVPYRTQLVPLAAVRAAVGDDIELHGVDAKLRRWY